MPPHSLPGMRRCLVVGAATVLATILMIFTGLPAAAEPGEAYAFDFQCAGNPTAAGYTAVPPATAYSAAQGYGFLVPLGSDACRDRGGEDLAGRDFVLPVAGSTFRADVPDGTYTVVVRTGDLIASSNTGFTVGGQTAPSRSAASGVIDERVLEGVEATGGHLDFVFSGSSTRLNSIQIIQPLPAPQGVTASVEATADTASVALS